MVVPFFWFLYIDNMNINIGIGKGDIHQLRNFKQKLKHKIGCCPKFLLILTTYQVQGWCTTYVTVGTGASNLPCAECPRPIYN